MQRQFLTRRRIVELCNEMGLPIGAGQLNKLMWRGDGPPVAGRWGNRDVFRPEDVKAWALARLSGAATNGSAT
jgi:hypothetical protein